MGMFVDLFFSLCLVLKMLNIFLYLLFIFEKHAIFIKNILKDRTLFMCISV